MSWAKHHIQDLLLGKSVKFRPSGHSMTGRVGHRQLVTVEPLAQDPKIDDIVLCKVQGRHYLHLIKAQQGDRYLIGNNRGGTNGWTMRKNLYGVVTHIQN